MMFTKILTQDQVKQFSELTGLKATKVFISKNKKYYYVTIVDELIKLRISKELASKFI